MIIITAICGADCGKCTFKNKCSGCIKADSHPPGGECVAAECYKLGGEQYFLRYKKQLIDEFNSLKVYDMPPVTTLYPLSGAYVNLEYTFPNGKKFQLLDDTKIYLGCQIEKTNSHRCYGLAADNDYLLICEYGCNGAEPEIVVYKRRLKITNLQK